MHEWALADAIVRTVLDYAQREGASRVKAVRVVLGELQDVAGGHREVRDGAALRRDDC